MENEAKSYDVFISHSAKDAELAGKICAAIEKAGLTCWIAPRDVPPGKDWAGAIHDAIVECRVMVLLLTGHSNLSQQIKREVDLAVSEQDPIVPFRTEEVELSTTLAYYLKSTHWLDAFTPPMSAHIERLVSAVKSHVEGGPIRIPPPPPPRRRRTILLTAIVFLVAVVGLLAAAKLWIGGGSSAYAFRVDGKVPEMVAVGQEFDLAFTFTASQTELPEGEAMKPIDELVVQVQLPKGLKSTDDTGIVSKTFTDVGPLPLQFDVRVRATEAMPDAELVPVFTVRSSPVEGRDAADEPVRWSIEIVEPKMALDVTGPAEFRSCDGLRLEWVITNTGVLPLRNVKVVCDPPATLAERGRAPGAPFERPVGDVPADESKAFVAMLDGTGGGTHEIVITLTADGVAPVERKFTTIARTPVLDVTVSAPSDVYLGRPVEYELAVQNTGDGSARDAVCRFMVPEGTQFVSATSGGRVDGPQVLWAMGEVPPAGGRQFGCVVQPQGRGDFAAEAQVSATCLDPVTSSEVTTRVRGISIPYLEMVDLEDPATPGETATYVLTLTNHGSEPTRNIKVVATYPLAMKFESSVGAMPWDDEGDRVVMGPVASLEPRQRLTQRLMFRAPTRTGPVRLQCVVTSDDLDDPISETENTNVGGQSVASVDLIAIDGAVEVGRQATFVLEITNQGSVALAEMQVKATLPAGLEFVSFSGAVKPTTSGRTVTWRSPGLAPRNKVTGRLVVKAVEAGQHALRVQVTVNAPDGETQAVERQSIKAY